MFAIGTHLQFVFIKSIDQKMFPENFKLAFISAVCKKDDANFFETIGHSQLIERLQNSLSVYFSIRSTNFHKRKNLSGSKFAFQNHKFSTDAVLHLFEALQENN